MSHHVRCRYPEPGDNLCTCLTHKIEDLKVDRNEAERERDQLRADLDVLRAAHHQVVDSEIQLRAAYELACKSEAASTDELVGANLEIARLREVLATLCYEAHVLVRANSTLSMAGSYVRPSFVRLNEAKIAGERVLGDFASEPSEGQDP